jgi:hypothetical protein
MLHTRAAFVAALSIASIGIGVAPASAATTGDTEVTFTIQGGLLQVSVPAEAELQTGGATLGSLLGSDVSGSLGPVTVTDNQGKLLGGWTATVTASDFTNTEGGQTSTIPAANVGYATGVITPVVGLSLSLGQLVPVANQTATWAVTTTAVGNSEAEWNPTVTVRVPDEGVAAGTYRGTITHSVA